MTLKIFNTEHEQNMKQLAKDMTKLNFIKTSESSNFEKEMQKIQNHGDVIKHHVMLIVSFCNTQRTNNFFTFLAK
jgi:uncharacterized protein Yka (UPF0111/DUF47 family)